MGYELPKKRSGVAKAFKDQKFLMIGGAGIGKSDFWQHSVNPLYIEAEQGLNFIDACKMPCRSWGDVAGIVKALETEAKKPGAFPYDLIVVDTIDRIVDYATESTIEWAKERFKGKSDTFKSLFDIPNGGGWTICRGHVAKFLKKIESLPCAIAIVGHLETKKIKEDASEYDKNTISIGGKVGGDILAWSDHTLNVVGTMRGDQLIRRVYTKPTKSKEAKSRGGIIEDGTAWGADSKKNFDDFRAKFD